MKLTRLHPVAEFVITTIVVMTFLIGVLVTFEPVVGRAVTDEFIVTQTITSEIAFVASTSDVAMDNPITSLTGGTSNGTTSVVVTTNDNDGYNLTIHFSSTTAMARNGGGGVIENYAPASAGTPDFAFDTSEAFGQFAYRVTGAQAADVDPTFRDNGTDTCAVGASNTYGTCWFNPEPVGGVETIINRSSATPAGGSTTTLNFRVYVPPNPTPTIPDGTYTATATITAVTN